MQEVGGVFLLAAVQLGSVTEAEGGRGAEGWKCRPTVSYKRRKANCREGLLEVFD